MKKEDKDCNISIQEWNKLEEHFNKKEKKYGRAMKYSMYFNVIAKNLDKILDWD